MSQRAHKNSMIIIPTPPPIIPKLPESIPTVPFYSQFADITAVKWQKRGCGIVSLAMVMNYYKPHAVTVNKLLTLGIASGAYDMNAGWKHNGLVGLAVQYGLTGQTYDLSQSTNTKAYDKFKSFVKDGPVIVSVHYKFDPKSTIPHLVVIDGIDDKGVIYYNDPAAKSGEKHISEADFLKGWKKRFIVIREKEAVV